MGKRLVIMTVIVLQRGAEYLVANAGNKLSIDSESCIARNDDPAVRSSVSQDDESDNGHGNSFRSRKKRQLTHTYYRNYHLCNVVGIDRNQGARLLRSLAGREYAGVIVALVVGDQRAIDQSDWKGSPAPASAISFPSPACRSRLLYVLLAGFGVPAQRRVHAGRGGGGRVAGLHHQRWPPYANDHCGGSRGF